MTVGDFEHLDKLVSKMQDIRVRYEEQKAYASKLYDELEEIKWQILQVLKENKKSKYHVEGLGTVSTVDKYSIKMPKDAAKKTEFLNFIKERFGPETLTDLITIHSQTLNSFFNDEKKKFLEGEAFDIPGLEQPTGYQEVRFRKG